MNYAAMIAEVKKFCDYTVDADIGEWINQAYLIMANRLAKIPAKATITFSTSYSLYDPPANCTSINKIKLDEDDFFMKRVEERDIDTDLTGKPYAYFLFGNKISPYPQASTDYPATLWYDKSPGKMVQDVDAPDTRIPEDYHMGPVNYAISKAKRVLGQRNSAVEFWADWLAVKDDFESYINGGFERRPRRAKARAYA